MAAPVIARLVHLLQWLLKCSALRPLRQAPLHLWRLLKTFLERCLRRRSIRFAEEDKGRSKTSEDNPPMATVLPDGVVCPSLLPTSSPSGPYLLPPTPTDRVMLSVDNFQLNDINRSRDSVATAPARYTFGKLQSRSKSSFHLPSQLSVVSAGGGDRLSITGSQISEQIYCSFPQALARYTRRVPMPETESSYTLEPLEMDYDYPPIPGWKRYVHPDGAPYYHDSKRSVLTDANLYDQEVFLAVERFVDLIRDFTRASAMALPDDAELVLDVDYSEESEAYVCGYYLVHHAKRCLFWLERHDISYMIQEVKGATEPRHCKLEIEVQYWLHWELFSNIRVVTHDILNELTDMLLSSITDTQTSDTPMAYFDRQQMENFLQLIKISRKSIDRSGNGYPWFVGRLMASLTRFRFINFYGHYGARLSSDQSIYGKTQKRRTVLITLISPLLFSAPDIHLRILEKIWVDEVITTQNWKGFINKLSSEWEGFILNSTVLLNANIAFLTIQSVDTAVPPPSRSPTQILIYLSTTASVGSIILGLLLVRYNRTKGQKNAADAAAFLVKHQRPYVGYEPLAIMYSLPYALLMWSTVFFLAAFSLLCFQTTNFHTRLIEGVAWIICAIFIIWCIWMNWERQPQETSFWQGLLSWGNWIQRLSSSATCCLPVFYKPKSNDEASPPVV